MEAQLPTTKASRKLSPMATSSGAMAPLPICDHGPLPPPDMLRQGSRSQAAMPHVAPRVVPPMFGMLTARSTPVKIELDDDMSGAPTATTVNTESDTVEDMESRLLAAHTERKGKASKTKAKAKPKAMPHKFAEEETDEDGDHEIEESDYDDDSGAARRPSMKRPGMKTPVAKCIKRPAGAYSCMKKPARAERGVHKVHVDMRDIFKKLRAARKTLGKGAFTSRAYDSAKRRAKKAGHTTEDVSAFAREQYSIALELWDAA